MKYLAIIMMLFSNVNLIGQFRNFNEIPKDVFEQLHKMGIDGEPLLNSYESAFLNIIFKNKLGGFDFSNKKIGFLTGSSGTTKSSKEYYFDMQKKHSSNENYPCDNGTLYIFNAVQKAESGGYDGAIVYWNKFLLPVDKVVKKLKKQH